jgi:flavin-binding protein dodecin
LSPFDSITRKENGMSVTKVIELSASSAESIEGAVREGLARAGKTVKNIRGAWINDIKDATDSEGNVREWRVNMRINFEVD